MREEMEGARGEHTIEDTSCQKAQERLCKDTERREERNKESRRGVVRSEEFDKRKVVKSKDFGVHCLKER